MTAKAIIRMPGEGKQVQLAGYPMAFLVTGEATRHTSMFEWTMPPGFSTGLHVHRVQEETFYVLEGECDWQVGDQRIRALPGSYLFLPPRRSAQHRQRHQPAHARADDGLATRA